MARFIQHIPGRGGYLGHDVSPKGQRLCDNAAACCRGQRRCQLALPEPDCLIPSNNVLGGAHLIHRAGQPIILIQRCVDRIAERIPVLAEALQHKSPLVDLNRALDGRVGNRNLLHNHCLVFCIRQDRNGDCEEQKQQEKPAHSSHSHLLPLFYDFEYGKGSGLGRCLLQFTPREIPAAARTQQESEPWWNTHRPDNHPARRFRRSHTRPRSAAASAQYRFRPS